MRLVCTNKNCEKYGIGKSGRFFRTARGAVGAYIYSSTGEDLGFEPEENPYDDIEDDEFFCDSCNGEAEDISHLSEAEIVARFI